MATVARASADAALAGATTTDTLAQAPTGPEATCAAETWEHVTRLPGLTLLRRGDRGAPVRRIAREIHER